MLFHQTVVVDDMTWMMAFTGQWMLTLHGNYKCLWSRYPRDFSELYMDKYMERTKHSCFALPNCLSCSVTNKICLNQTVQLHSGIGK